MVLNTSVKHIGLILISNKKQSSQDDMSLAATLILSCQCHQLKFALFAATMP